VAVPAAQPWKAPPGFAPVPAAAPPLRKLPASMQQIAQSLLNPPPASPYTPNVPLAATPWTPTQPASMSHLKYYPPKTQGLTKSANLTDKNSVVLFDGRTFRWRFLEERIVPSTAKLSFSLGVAYEVLKILRGCCAKVAIAGGFARDVYLARYDEINDIDFFTEGFDEAKFAKEIAASSLIQHVAAFVQPATTSNSKYAAATIQSVTDYHFVSSMGSHPNSQKIQIVDCDLVEKNILQFDFGINMIMITELSTAWFTHSPALEYKINYNATEFFMNSVLDESLDFFPDLIDPQRLKNLVKRKNKMLGKFPGFTLQIKPPY
jgi:hypothetical protein